MIGVCCWDQIGLQNGIQCHGIDADTWAFCNNDSDRRLEGEVHEECNIVGALSALCQSIKDEKALEALRSHALHVDCQWIQEALCYASSSHNANGPEPFVEAQSPRQADADGEYPLAVLEVKSRLDLTAPPIEGEQVDCGEGVDAVHGDTDEGHEPEPNVRQNSPEGSAAEVGQGEIVPFRRLLGLALFSLAEAAHGCCWCEELVYVLGSGGAMLGPASIVCTCLCTDEVVKEWLFYTRSCGIVWCGIQSDRQTARVFEAKFFVRSVV